MWPFKTQEQKDAEARRHGYAWAATKLLKGADQAEIEAESYCDQISNAAGPFEWGIEDALIDWKALKAETKEVRIVKCGQCGEWFPEEDTGICRHCEEPVCDECQAPFTVHTQVTEPLHKNCLEDEFYDRIDY